MAPLEAFDPNSFLGNEEWPQPMCNLVLGLSLFYNDYRDLLGLAIAIQEDPPLTDPKESPEWALHYGQLNSLRRLLSGVFSELFNLVSTHEKVVRSKEFKRLYKQMRSDARFA